MSTSDWIAVGGIATAFFITLIGSVWHLSFRIASLCEKVDGLSKKTSYLEEKVEKLYAIVTQIRIDMAEMQVKLDILWRTHIANSHSPIAPNELGREMLAKSNIGAFADLHYDAILLRVKSMKPENAYQAQELLISVIRMYKNEDAFRLTLQETAYSSGYDIDSLLLVAALSIRDRVVSDLGFQP